MKMNSIFIDLDIHLRFVLDDHASNGDIMLPNLIPVYASVPEL
jgi:hypothetical protein